MKVLKKMNSYAIENYLRYMKIYKTDTLQHSAVSKYKYATYKHELKFQVKLQFLKELHSDGFL